MMAQIIAWCAVCLLAVSALLQLAVLRDPRCIDSDLAAACRKLVIIAEIGLALRLGGLAAVGEYLYPPSMLLMSILAIGTGGYAIDKLQHTQHGHRRAGDEPKHHHRTS